MTNANAGSVQRNAAYMHDSNEERDEPEIMTGFSFKRRRGHIDWRKIDRVDLDSIVNDIDIDALQEHVEDIAFADITEDDYLMKQNRIEKDHFSALQDRLSDAEKVIASKDEELRSLRKECRHIRKVAHAYERMIGMTGQIRMPNERGPLLSGRHYECPFCNSSFISEHHLQAHIGRRHPNQSFPSNDAAKAPDSVSSAQIRDQSPSQQQLLNADQIETLIQNQTSVVMEEWMTTAKQMLKEALNAMTSAQHPPPPPPPVIIQQPAVDAAIERALISQEISQRMLSLEGKFESVKAMVQVDLAQRTSQRESNRQQSPRRRHRSRVGPLEPVDSDTDSAPVYGKSTESDHNRKEDIQEFLRKSIDGFKTGLVDEVRRAVLPIQNAISAEKGKHFRLQDQVKSYMESEKVEALSAAHTVKEKIRNGELDDPNTIQVQQSTRVEQPKNQLQTTTTIHEERFNELKLEQDSTNTQHKASSDDSKAHADIILVQQMDLPDSVLTEELPLSVDPGTSFFSQELLNDKKEPMNVDQEHQTLVEPVYIPSEPEGKGHVYALFPDPSITIVETFDNIKDQQIEQIGEIPVEFPQDYNSNNNDDDETKRKISIPNSTNGKSTPTTNLTNNLLSLPPNAGKPEESDIDFLNPPSNVEESKRTDIHGQSQWHKVFKDEPYCHVFSQISHPLQYMAQEKEKIEALVEECTENDYRIMEKFIAESGYDRTPTLFRVQTLMDQHYKAPIDISTNLYKQAETELAAVAPDIASDSNRAPSRTQSPRYEAELRSQSANSDLTIEEIDL